MRFYKIKFTSWTGPEPMECEEKHIPETALRNANEVAMDILDVSPCDCDKCLKEAKVKLERIREVLG